MISLLGAGLKAASVLLSTDEKRALDRLYGYTPEKANEKPPAPVDPGRDASWKDKEAYKFAKAAHDRWTDPRDFMQAGADRNVTRYAERDGLRVIAWLAKYVEPGQDPLKMLVQLVSEAGFDVDPADVGWADEETVDQD